MSARRTRGGDLKDSKEEGGKEAEAEAEATSESGMKTVIGHTVDSDAAVVLLNAESKKRRVSAKEASIDYLDSATTTATSTVLGDSSAEAVGKVGGGTMQCGAAAGQASAIESTAHSEVSVDIDDAHASADGASVASGASLVDATVAMVDTVVAVEAAVAEPHFITAENYHLLHWLYRIRDVSCLRGLRISFLQPDFLWSIYRPMMRSRKLWRTDGDIRVAADLWCFDRAAAEERYGHIGDWDVSSVTCMSQLFQVPHPNDPMQDSFRGKDLFNDDISRWDVSSVTSMSRMFACAGSFNQPIGDWDVSKVTNMSLMFNHAHAFNQPVGDWVVPNVTDMCGMFANAQSFNQPVGDWDISKVTDVGYMFYVALLFDQDLTRWDTSSVEYADNMFLLAPAMQRDNKPAAVRDDVDDDSEVEEAEEDDAGV